MKKYVIPLALTILASSCTLKAIKPINENTPSIATYSQTTDSEISDLNLFSLFYLQPDSFYSKPESTRLQRTEIKDNLELKLDTPLSEGTYRITSKFGAKRSFGGGITSRHSGIDFGAKYGTEVSASADGTVILSDWDERYGKYVILSHSNETQTLYAHLSERKVKAGEKIQRGQIIGKVGSTGNSTGPHLHYEVRKDGNSVNPEEYLQ